MNKIAIITSFLLAFVVSYAQETNLSVVVRGTVVEDSVQRIPVIGATIVALGTNGELIKGTVTQKDGSYLLELTTTPANIEIACVGYQKQRFEYDELPQLVVLHEEVTEMEAVVVSSRRPLVKLKGAEIDVKVAGSVLVHETNLDDFLRKIPGLVSINGKLQTVDGSTPVIYIDGKKASTEELKMLDVKSIKSVVLNTAPGVRYGAEVGAVLNIKTTTPLEGLSFVADHLSRLNHRYTHDNTLDLKYRTRHLTLLGGIGYSDYRKESQQDMNTIIAHSTGNRAIENSLKSDISNKEYLGNVGFEYILNDKVEFGAKYSGSLEGITVDATDNSKAQLAGHSPEQTVTTILNKDRDKRHHFDAFLTSTPTQQLAAELYFNFFRTEGDRTQAVQERSSLLSERHNLKNYSHYDLLSAQPNVSYNISEGQSVEVGGEYIHIAGESFMDRETGRTSEYNTTSQTAAGYANYSIQFGSVALSAGARYEYVAERIENRLDATKNTYDPYSNILGNLTLSSQLGAMQHSLTFKSSVIRPRFGYLNNYSSYLNRYMTQLGNQLLRPAVSYQAQYNFVFQFIYASLSYTFVKDYIGNYFYTPSSAPDQFIASWKNFKNNQEFQALLAAGYQMAFYRPSLTLLGRYSVLSSDDQIGIKPKPLFYVDWNNDFILPWGITFNAEYSYQSAASMLFLSFQSQHIVNVSLRKSFFDDNLTITLKGHDLFAGEINRYKSIINNLQFAQTEDQDRRYISLSVRWRFHKYRDRYRGQSPTDAINRF